MKPIQLLFAENVAPRHRTDVQQRLSFCIAVENLAYEKSVEVHWSGADGQWRILPARYVRTCDSREVWQADATFGASDGPIPADVEFAVRYRVGAEEWWDNNDGRNFRMPADSGVRLGPGIDVINLHPEAVLHRHHPQYAITVAVAESLPVRDVRVHWTTDRWRTVHESPCHFRHASRRDGTWAPAERAAAIWGGQLRVEQATRLEYAIGCITEAATVWDNNFGQNYVAFRDRLKVLTLNLHCWQEEDADRKLSQIARAIDDYRFDIVCLQEVAEPWNDGQGDVRGNSAHIIRSRLKNPYHLVHDWSHLGFGQYREGSAILSRYDVTLKDSGYVSASHDAYDIHARKIVMAQVQVPRVGPVNVYCAHLSWWSDGFKVQFDNLRRWADERHTEGVAATLLCGDFNSEPDSAGYGTATEAGEYEDQYLRLHAPDGNGGDRRIDYIFLKRGSALRAVASEAIFTASDYGRVSDHPGYYAEFEREE